MQQIITTENVAVAERFAFWQEALGQSAVPFKARSEHASNFTASIAAARLGALQTLAVKHSPVQIERSHTLIRRSDPEVYGLGLVCSGVQEFTHRRDIVNLSPGSLILFHSSRPFETRSHTRHAVESAVVALIPARLIALPAKKLPELVGNDLNHGGPIERLVAHHLLTMTRDADRLGPADATRLASITMDLISLMLVRELDAETMLPAETRDQALLARIHDFIESHLSEPQLTPSLIAEAHHISIRTLHRLFQHQGHTVGAWIRDRRLDRCRRELVDPRSSTRSIRSIAAGWGFTDNRHFSRAFRVGFGISPRDLRQQATYDQFDRARQGPDDNGPEDNASGDNTPEDNGPDDKALEDNATTFSR